MTDGSAERRDPAVVEARVRRRRRWVIFRMLRVLVIAASMVVAAGVVGAVAVSRTEAGRRLVLQRALQFVNPRINGTVVVGALGPAGLLGGARIYDIRVMDGDGHRVLSIDSLQIRYSLLELVGGSPAVSDLSLWRPELVLERESDGRVNVAALLDTGPVDMDTTLVQDTTALARGWIEGRVRRSVSYEDLYCAELVAITYERMGLLDDRRPPNWYDPGRFWSGDKLVFDGATLGPEIEITDVPPPPPDEAR